MRTFNQRTGSLYGIAAVAATAGLLFGFDTAVINEAISSLRLHFALSAARVEFAAISLLYGCFLGALVAGFLSDGFGRRSILRISGSLFLLSAIFACLQQMTGSTPFLTTAHCCSWSKATPAASNALSPRMFFWE